MTSTVDAQSEQVTNGDLENRYSPPSQDADIGPGNPDDLPNWDATPSVTNPNTNRPANGNDATYVASDGATGENTNTWGQDHSYTGAYSPYSFSAHSGKSCVVLYRHQYFHGTQDSYMTQRLNNALQPGHSYQIQFWLLRLPGNAFQSQIALSVTNGAPVYDPYNHVLNPSGALVVVAPNIDQRSVWTLVTGSITIPASQNPYQWVTVSYSTSLETAGGTNDANFTDIWYAVDDISIKECTPPNAPDINLAPWAGSGSGQNSVEYDVRVNNVGGASGFSLKVEEPDGNGGWSQAGTTYNQSAYAGPDDASRNEASGFTTFHLHLKGPIANNGPGDTYRFTVTTSGPCVSTVAQRVIQLPAKDGGTSESNAVTVNPQSQNGDTDATTQFVSVAYPNPAAQTLVLPTNISSGVLLNNLGQAVQQIGSSPNLDVSTLPNGLYNLRVVQAGKVLNQRIEVRH